MNDKQNTSLATQSINIINIDSSCITQPNLFNVAVATEMFLPPPIFGRISLTLAIKDQQPESFPTYIPANALYFRETSNPTYPDINNHAVQRGLKIVITTDKDISLTAKSNTISIIKNTLAPTKYFRGLAAPVSNLTSIHLSNVLPNVTLTSFKSPSIASLLHFLLTLDFPILHNNIEIDNTILNKIQSSTIIAKDKIIFLR